MATPTEPILVIATSELGSDGFTNKEAPTAPVTNEGYGKQSLPYQQANYLWHWQANWIKYINEEQIPEVSQTLQDQVDTINNTTIPDETTAREDADNILQNNIDTINNTTIPNESIEREDADAILQSQIDTSVTDINFLANNHGIGYAQTWQNVSASRGANITYTNSTGKPIFVSLTVTDSGSSDDSTFYIDSIIVARSGDLSGGDTFVVGVVVPNNSTYLLSTLNPVYSWAELR